MYLIELHGKSPFSDYLYLDALRYDSWAQSIAFGVKGIIESTFRAPLYPIFLAVIYKILGHDLFVARLMQMLLTASTCVMIYFIALKVFDNKRTAIISSLLGAFYGPLYYWAGEILIVTLIVFLDLATLLILLYAFDKPKKTYWLLGGVVLGLSAIARPNVLIIIPWIAFLILMMHKYKTSVAPTRQRRMHLLLFVTGILLIIAPVTIRNWISAKDFVLISSQGGINFYMGNNPDADGKSAQPPGRVTAHGEFLDDAWLASVALAEDAVGGSLKPSQVSRFWYLQGIRFVLKNPGEWLKLMFRKFAYFWTGIEVTNNEDAYYFTKFSKVLGLLMWHRGLAFPFGIICPLALVGIIISYRYWRRLLLLYGFMFFYMLSVVLFFVCTRYRMPVIPVLLIFAGFTVNYSVEKLKSGQYKPLACCLAGMASIGILANLDIGGVEYRNRARAHLYAGSAYETLGKHEPAIEEFRQAIDLLPENLEASHGLGIAYMEIEDYHSAERMFKKVLRIDPYCAPAHFNLGSVYVARRRYREAADEYQAALDIDPNYELAACWAGMMQEKLNQWEQALEKWEMVLQINPRNAQARSKIDHVRRKLKEPVATR